MLNISSKHLPPELKDRVLPNRPLAPNGSLAGDSPVVRTIDEFLQAADKAKAAKAVLSPIGGGALEIRFEMNGGYWPVGEIPAQMGRAAVVRMKLMAGIDIAERRISQKGHMTLMVGDHARQITVTTEPAAGEEEVTIAFSD